MARIIQIDLNKMLDNTPYTNGRVVGVALSGGRDSVVLCHALKEAGESIVALNVEHGIRGENSLRDSEFVKEFCKAQGIKLFSFSVDAPSYAKEQGLTLEQAARVLRYRVFDKALEDGLCDVVALAHHSGDQAETILMRILRGTGTKGLVGMKAVNGRYIRPLLNYSREDIDVYIAEHKLAFVEDETNADLSYSRNLLRAEIARLKERYPDLENSFARLSRVAEETEEFVDSVLPPVEVKNGEVFIKDEDAVSPFVLKRLILKGAELLGVDKDVEEKHLNAVVDLLKNEAGKRLNLSHGLVAHREQHGIVLAKDSSFAIGKVEPFEVREYEDLGVAIERVELLPKEALKGGEVLYCDLDKFPSGCVVRGRLDGDYINKFGGGTKSVGDFLTDKKVPLRKRDGLKVIAKDSEVFAIFGVEISSKVKVDADTNRIAKLSIRQ
ncbi:MAG: tRNA lysidine(34) synthetase TilS [Clostridia bacterium]|nr:tRNA lysidine(34) synthetase TilS [Clostridia bacterium]